MRPRTVSHRFLINAPSDAERDINIQRFARDRVRVGTNFGVAENSRQFFCGAKRLEAASTAAADFSLASDPTRFRGRVFTRRGPRK